MFSWCELSHSHIGGADPVEVRLTNIECPSKSCGYKVTMISMRHKCRYINVSYMCIANQEAIANRVRSVRLHKAAPPGSPISFSQNRMYMRMFCYMMCFL